MEIQVLGPVTVIGDDGSPLLSAGATQRHLLAVLAAQPGRVVSAERLQDLLGVSYSGLRSAASRLRKCVGPDVLASQAPGYCLDTGAIDSIRFEALFEDARGCRPEQAEGPLVAALRLWKGRPFAEFADEEWATSEVARLEELQAGIVEELAEALIGQGRWPEAISDLERHVAAHPYRDRPRGLLMRALAADGRQVEALRAYQTYRRLLADEVGTEPSREVRDLEERIASGWSDADTPGLTIGTTAVDDEVRTEPDHHVEPVAGNVARPLSRFVGRVDELDELESLLDEHRLVTIVGPAGVGKSRIAVEVAQRHRTRTSGGCWMVALASLPAGSDIEEVVTATLEPLTGPAHSLESALAAIRGRDVLVVLDNCEHVISSVADVAATLVGSAEGVRVVCTSRQPVDIAGEAISRLAPLATRSQAGEGDDPTDAASLLFQRAQEAGSEVGDDESLGLAERVCARVAGLPLAIELAAARLRTMTLTELEDALDRQLDVLHRTRSDSSRHVSLEAALDWSYRLLDRDEQTVLAQASVFAGPFADEALAAVVTSSDRRAADVARSLADKSLLNRHVDGATRFSMLETIRQFADSRLDTEARRACRGLHAQHFMESAERALAVADQADTRELLEPMLIELQVASGWVGELGDPDFGRRLLELLSSAALLCGRAHLDQGATETALEIAEQGLEVAPENVELLQVAADSAHRLGRGDVAMGHARRWQWIARATQHSVGEIDSQALIARLMLESQDFDGSWAAVVHLERLVDSIPFGPDRTEAKCRIAHLLMTSGRLEEALAVADSAIAEAPADDQSLTRVYHAKGTALCEMAHRWPGPESQDLDREGKLLLHKSRQLAAERHDPLLGLQSLFNIASRSPLPDRRDLAEALRTEALAAGVISLATTGVDFLHAEIAWHEGDLTEARRRLEGAMKSLTHRDAVTRLAVVTVEAGDLVAARGHLDRWPDPAADGEPDTEVLRILAPMTVAALTADRSSVDEFLVRLVAFADEIRWRPRRIWWALDSLAEVGVERQTLAPLLSDDRTWWTPDEAFLAGWIAERDDPELARELFSQALAGSTDDTILAASAQVELAKLSSRQGNRADARAELEQAVEKLERWPGPRQDRALALLESI